MCVNGCAHSRICVCALCVHADNPIVSQEVLLALFPFITVGIGFLFHVSRLSHLYTHLYMDTPLYMNTLITCVSMCAGNSFVALDGLQPGVYYYKFIVDGTWAIDPLAPKVQEGAPINFSFLFKAFLLCTCDLKAPSISCTRA